MAKTLVDYVAIYGMIDPPESPSSIARRTRSENPDVYKTEICTKTTPWENSTTVIRHFMGLESGSEPIPENVANYFIDSWRNDWPQPKFETKENDLR